MGNFQMKTSVEELALAKLSLQVKAGKIQHESSNSKDQVGNISD